MRSIDKLGVCFVLVVFKKWVLYRPLPIPSPTSPSTKAANNITKVVIIRLGYTHRFYKNAFSKTVLNTYTV